MKRRRLAVVILGAGKVGSALARGLVERGWPVRLCRGRTALPRKPWVADLVVIAVRDVDVAKTASALAVRELVPRGAAVVHVAGALGPEVLAPLRDAAVAIGQMHPMASFASRKHPPRLVGVHVLVDGDPLAVRRASLLARALDMRPRHLPTVDRDLYHAAAGLLANGAAALASVAADLLVAAGVPRRQVPSVMGPLLGTVSRNVERLGLPRALTGPVRRGDVETVRRHLAAAGRRSLGARELYAALCAAQLPMARALGDADAGRLRALAALVRQERRRLASSPSQRPEIPRPGRGA